MGEIFKGPEILLTFALYLLKKWHTCVCAYLKVDALRKYALALVQIQQNSYGNPFLKAPLFENKLAGDINPRKQFSFKRKTLHEKLRNRVFYWYSLKTPINIWGYFRMLKCFGRVLPRDIKTNFPCIYIRPFFLKRLTQSQPLKPRFSENPSFSPRKKFAWIESLHLTADGGFVKEPWKGCEKAIHSNIFMLSHFMYICLTAYLDSLFQGCGTHSALRLGIRSSLFNSFMFNM